MSTLSKVLCLFTLALSVSGLAAPHVARSPHDHHALAARMAAPALSPAVGPYGRDVRVVKPKKMRKRGDTGRCRAKSSSATPSSTSASASPSSSSEEAAPTTPVANVASFSEAPAPSSSSTHVQKPTTTSKPPATTSASDSGSSGSGSSNLNLPSFLVGTQTGQATFYGIGLGACGITNSGSDRIAAVSKLLFDVFPGYNGVNPNTNPVCGKSVTLTYKGKSTTVTVTDRCEACALTDLDLSPTSFDDLASEALGRLSGVTWVWNN